LLACVQQLLHDEKAILLGSKYLVRIRHTVVASGQDDGVGWHGEGVGATHHDGELRDEEHLQQGVYAGEN
jgi:hypothetical protein